MVWIIDDGLELGSHLPEILFVLQWWDLAHGTMEGIGIKDTLDLGSAMGELSFRVDKYLHMMQCRVVPCMVQIPWTSRDSWKTWILFSKRLCDRRHIDSCERNLMPCPSKRNHCQKVRHCLNKDLWAHHGLLEGNKTCLPACSLWP